MNQLLQNETSLLVLSSLFFENYGKFLFGNAKLAEKLFNEICVAVTILFFSIFLFVRLYQGISNFL